MAAELIVQDKKYHYYYLKRSAMQGRERTIYTLSVQRPQPNNTNL